MKEKELIDLGFKKIEVPDKESDNGYDYYYYELNIMEGLSLISTDNIDAKKDKWYVTNPSWSQKHTLSKEAVVYLKELSL
jgi:hypothetical protein